MSAVMIRCPKTGKPVNTGVTASKRRFETELFEGYAVSCPHCKKVHAWKSTDAYLQKSDLGTDRSSGPGIPMTDLLD
jgi:endogenous inhibitor of DNA gyrase (YacG/DUF329 family)